MNQERDVSPWCLSHCKLVLFLLSTTLITGISPVQAQLSSSTTQEELSLTTSPQSSSESNSSTTESEPLDFSDTGRSGQQTAADTRHDSCPDTSLPLTALVPNSNSGQTIATHPRFWFYVPYHAQQINRIEFVIQDTEDKDISRQNVPINSDPGYVSASLPYEQSELEIGQWYQWYFKVYCQAHKYSAPLFVHGWIKRRGLNSEFYWKAQNESLESLVYARQGLWFDAIDNVLNSYSLNPHNRQIKQDWEKLINAQGVELELPPLQ